jgi:uncharacterized SAM-binding protein YcdF (DUF218 family)
MFILKKILTPLLLPPGIFIVILMFSGLWFLFKKNWKAGAINCLIGISLWSLSIAPVSDALMRGLESDLKIPEKAAGDVIILLGGGVNDKVPDLTGIGAPSGDMIERIVTAVRLQKRLDIPVIVSGGAVFKGRAAEAPIVRRFLVDLGVPDNKIIVEDKSRDTIENAKYTKEIGKKYGFKKPILITSAFHIKRSVLSFKKVEIEVTPFPTGFRTWKDRRYGWEDYLPGSLNQSYAALREYMGLLFYKLAY